MKKLIALCAASATLLGTAALSTSALADENAGNGAAVNTSDAQATAETRALFASLRDTQAGDVRFGQQHATDEHISPTATQGDVYEMTGKYPRCSAGMPDSCSKVAKSRAVAPIRTPTPHCSPTKS